VNDVPTVADVVEAFRGALTGDLAAATPEDVLGLLLTLHRNNVEQWHQEDLTRDAAADDATVAAAKRAIDTLNGTRHRLVEAVDAALYAAIEQSPDAPPTTETPGMVFDRLSVLTIRLHVTEAAGDAHADRLPALEAQLASLEDALDALLDDVGAGRRRFVPYESLKLYGSPEPDSR
jgi:hypothetical protein